MGRHVARFTNSEERGTEAITRPECEEREPMTNISFRCIKQGRDVSGNTELTQAWSTPMLQVNRRR